MKPTWRFARADTNHRLLNAPARLGGGDLPTGWEGAQSGGQASAEQCGPHRVAQALAPTVRVKPGAECSPQPSKNQLGRWEETVAWCRRSIEANRNIFQPHCELAMALAQLDRLDEARSAIKAALAILPNFTISGARASWTAMSHNPSYLAALEPQFESLRALGVPE
jgi:hypothetical protein